MTTQMELVKPSPEQLGLLVSAAGIARRCWVERSTVRHWRGDIRFGDFPEPVAGVGEGVQLYWWPDVEAWLKSKGLPQ